MIKRNILKYAGIIIVFIALFLSNKRTGSIAFVTSFVAYYVLNIIKSDKNIKNKIFSIVTFLITGTVFVFIFIYFSDKTGGILLNRFSTLEEDQGSGRYEIWINTLVAQSESNSMEWIIGHGWRAVENSYLGVSAHNDFLEVLYDYGIIGFILYLFFHGHLIIMLKRMYKYNYRYLNAFAVSYIIFLVLSLFSHLVVYPTYFIFLCFFWGITIADFENINNQRLYQLERAKIH